MIKKNIAIVIKIPKIILCTIKIVKISKFIKVFLLFLEMKEKELKEIRKILEESENPLYFYDDDTDGLCSYLLLKKKYEKGKGICVKGSPVLDEKFVRKVNEIMPDKVIILDMPIVTQDFIDKVNVPIIWIDHHEIQEREGVKIYNPRKWDKEDNRPTAYWCYRIVEENLWIGMIGTVGDWYLPKEYLGKFRKDHGLLKEDVKEPGEALFNTEFGKLVRIFNFVLKESVTNVKNVVSVLLKIEDPFDILEGKTSKGRFVYKMYEKINKGYDELLEKALDEIKDEKVIVFIYSAKKTTFTGDLGNELLYKFPDRLIIIGRVKEDRVMFSLRSGKYKVSPLVKKAVSKVEGHGGGHLYSCGANIAKEDYVKFIEEIKKGVK